MAKKKQRKLRFVVGAPEEDSTKRYISGHFCPLVAIVRVVAKKQFDPELGIAPLYYIDKKDGRPKSNLLLQVIRWDPQHKQFVMEQRVFLCPVDRHGKEMAKDRQIRVNHRQALRVGNIHLRTTLHSEMRYRAASYLSTDVDRFIDLFEIDYSMDDAKARLEEPEKLAELPKHIPGFSVLVPEKVSIQKIITKEVDGVEKDIVKDVVATPHFHGNIQFTEVKDATTPPIQAKGLLNVTNLQVDCVPLVLWADIVRLHGWSPIHLSALSGTSSGLKVDALDRLQWVWTNVSPLSDKEQRVLLWRDWRELVKDDELLQKFPELDKLGPAYCWAAMVYDHSRFETVKGIGPKTAEKLAKDLRVHDFKDWIQKYPILASMVSEVRDGWAKETEEGQVPETVASATSAPEPKEEEKDKVDTDPPPSGDDYGPSF